MSKYFKYNDKIIVMKKIFLSIGLVFFLIFPFLVNANDFDPKQLVGKKFQTKEKFLVFDKMSKSAENVCRISP